MEKRFVDLIHDKKCGREISREDIQKMIEQYTAGEIPDYQMSAMLMAVCFQGMTDQELTALTLSMAHSGKMMDLSKVEGTKVDKHSTGGVGDKTTLIIGPIVAAAGVPVAKMSGRGLGFTGGTIDKLESIPGFRTGLEMEEFFQYVNRVGICVAGQSADLAPADKMLYALRDVTATVESIPLIAASVMSKKLAAGSDKILLDVTTGSGAFMKGIEDAKELAERMVAIGTHAGRETVALITDMNEPLGFAIGNNLEVKEAIDTLNGNGPADLVEICLALAANMIWLSGKESEYESCYQIAKLKLEDGSALEKFRQMVVAQGGDVKFIDEPDCFAKAECMGNVTAWQDGYIVSMNTEEIGVASGMLGAGRETKESTIDVSAGIVMQKKIGDYVSKGETIAHLYAGSSEKVGRAGAHMKKHISIGSDPPEKHSRIYERIISIS